MKKLNTKYIVAIIISFIIGVSILGYGYMNYKYETNRDLQKILPTPTINPMIDIKIKELEDQINVNKNGIKDLNDVYKTRLDSMKYFESNDQLYSQNKTSMDNITVEIHTLESQNIELNRQKTELLLKE